MKRRKWDSQAKARIVLEGLRGRPVGDLCSEHQVSQTQYYQWRDQFLSHAHRVFEATEQTRTETRLQRENQRLKQVVGELAVELKKTEEETLSGARGGTDPLSYEQGRIHEPKFVPRGKDWER